MFKIDINKPETNLRKLTQTPNICLRVLCGLCAHLPTLEHNVAFGSGRSKIILELVVCGPES